MHSQGTDPVVVIKYPVLRVQAEPAVTYLFENANYLHVLKNVFERFDATCRFHAVSHSPNKHRNRSLTDSILFHLHSLIASSV